MEATTMSTLLTELGQVVTYSFGTGLPAVFTLILDQPLLLLTVGMMVAGFLVSLLGRLYSKS